MSDLNIKIASQLSGHFRIEAHAPDGTTRVLADWFENLITDGGLNRIGVSGGWLGSCFVGTGTAQPAVTDAGMTSYVAHTSATQNSSHGAAGTEPYYGWKRVTYRFAQGAAAGNLSEVGIGWVTQASPLVYALFSHARIKDGGGNDTTITVQANEILDVTYEIRIYSPTADVTGSVTLASVNYNTTLRAGIVTDSWRWGASLSTNYANFNPSESYVYNGPIGSVTGGPSGSYSQASSVTTDAYSNNSLKITGTHNWSIDDGNLTNGVKSFRFAGSGAGLGLFQVEFDNYIPKDNTKTLSFTTELSWARKT